MNTEQRKRLAAGFGILVVIWAGLAVIRYSGADRPARLDPAKVPEELRALVPLAQEWGIGDDVARGAKAARATPEERARVRAAVTPHQTRITAWLDSFGGGVMPNEAAAFMYLQLAIEEMPPP